MSNIPKILIANDSIITNLVEIANLFNNYFSSIASPTKAIVKYSHKHFSNFLKNRAQNYFLLSPTDKDKITFIIFSLDSTKSVGPDGVPTNLAY